MECEKAWAHRRDGLPGDPTTCVHIENRNPRRTDTQAWRIDKPNQRQEDQLLLEKARWQKAKARSFPTETKATWHHQNSVLPQQQILDTPNTPEKQELDLKPRLMMLTEDFNKDINKSIKKYRRTWVNR